MLKLDQPGGFLVEVDAGGAGHFGGGPGGHGGAGVGRSVGALHPHADLGHCVGIGIGDGLAVHQQAAGQAIEAQGVAIVGAREGSGRDPQGVVLARHTGQFQHDAVVAQRLAAVVAAAADHRVAGTDVEDLVAAGIIGEVHGQRAVVAGGRQSLDRQRGDADGTGVARADGGRHRVGGGQQAWVLDQRAEVGGRAFDRPEPEAVARRRRIGADLQGEAVDRLAIADRLESLAVRQAGQPIEAGAGRIGLQPVLAGLQCRCVGHGDADRTDQRTAAVAGVVGRRHAGHAQAAPGVVEQRRAGVVEQVAAQRLPGVQRIGQADHQLVQPVAGVRQVAVLEAQQAADHAVACCGVVQRHDPATGLHAHGHAVGVGQVGQRHQCVGMRALHQRLATADKHVGGLVGADVGLYLQLLADPLDQLVALVEQLIGPLAAAGGRDDAQVELGQFGGQGVDLVDAALHVVFQVGLQHLDLQAAGPRQGREIFQPAQHRLACRQVGRRGGHIGKGVEDLRRGLAEPGFAAGEHLFQLRQHVAAHAIGRRGRRRGDDLAAEVHVRRPGHRADGDAAAEVARPVEGGAARGGQLGRLARVTRRVGVGDVVAGDLQLGVGHRSGLPTQGHQREGAHAACASEPVRNLIVPERRAKTVLI